MLHAKIGQKMTRIVPPQNGFEGYAQTGEVVEVTETEIAIKVLVDQYRIMRFSRKDGTESACGSFLVCPDWI